MKTLWKQHLTDSGAEFDDAAWAQRRNLSGVAPGDGSHRLRECKQMAGPAVHHRGAENPVRRIDGGRHRSGRVGVGGIGVADRADLQGGAA